MLKNIDTKRFPLILVPLLSLTTIHPMKALKIYNRSNSILFATTENNGLIGVRISKNFCEIPHISVLPSFQKRRIATLMIQQIINLYPDIELIIAETDLEAVTFYKKFGFNPIKLPSKYPDTTRFLCIYNVEKSISPC